MTLLPFNNIYINYLFKNLYYYYGCELVDNCFMHAFYFFQDHRYPQLFNSYSHNEVTNHIGYGCLFTKM